jgi:hypothetical protein
MLHIALLAGLHACSSGADVLWTMPRCKLSAPAHGSAVLPCIMLSHHSAQQVPTSAAPAHLIPPTEQLPLDLLCS